MIDLTIEREDVDESFIHRSNLKRDMLKEFSSAKVLRETMEYVVIGKLEEGTESGVDREVLGDFIDFFDWRSGLVENIG